MRPMIRANAILYVAILFSLGAGLRERMRLSDAVQEVSSLRDRNGYLETYKKALIRVLNDVELDSPFLAADIGIGSESGGLLMQEPNNIVLYRLSTDCPICPSNYGFLNDLTDAGVLVIGLAVDSAEAVVERHRSAWDVRFPILVHPRGSAADLVPRYGTPTIVVISHEEVVFLEFGELEPEAQQTLRILTRAWTKNWTDLTS